MKVFAIGDLHLPGGDKKPMDIFGPHWADHFSRICEDWRARVSPRDIVLIPGDISWAMQLADAARDLEAIGALPGVKIILRGNHDYWWTSLTQLRAVLPPGMHAVQNDAFDGGGAVFCGTRGWTIPPRENACAQDVKLYRREELRLEMSLRQARELAQGRPVVAMMHFPPVTLENLACGTAFTRLLAAYGVTRCVYGHLHGASIRRGFCGEMGGVRYDLVSCDALGFRLLDVTPRRADGAAPLGTPGAG